jgi:hypothetical protein
MKKTGIFLLIMMIASIQVIFAEIDGTTKRFGLFIGANNGGQGRQTLRYAVSDAKAVNKVFLDMGGIETDDATLLVEPTVREINQQIDSINNQLNEAKKSYKRTELVFYYSGHSDEDGLLLNRERYNYRELREKINNLPSDMRIIILDSCSSGAITRAKGGVKTKPFMIDDSNAAEGYAFLTSSSADEVSQESDLIESSYFTHSLVAGLRGAAETVGDRRITLNELYGFAYTETLAKTETSMYGAQHPNYDMQISGTGDVILTDMSETSASMILGEDVTGRISIRDSSDYLIAEVTKASPKAMELGLEPGAYQLILQQGDRFFRTNVTLTENKQTPVTMGNFTLINASAAVARGNDFSFYEEDFEPVKEPFKFELIQDSWFGKIPEKTTNNFIFGLVSADGYNLEGIGIGAIVGLANTGYVHGIQISNMYNIADSLQGVQLSSGLNWVSNSFDGLQAGLVNVGKSSGKGLQAGLVNWMGGSLDGLQAGLVNVAGGNGKGSQYGLVNWTRSSHQGAQAGLVNISRQNSTGLQAGLVNVTGDSFTGLQTGLVNVSGEEGKSAQIGLVNISQNPNVFPIGLINLVKDGIFHPAVFTDDMLFANLSLRTGSKYFYTIWITGFKHFDVSDKDETWTSFSDDNGENYYTSRIGLGGELPLGPIFLNLDVTAGSMIFIEKEKIESEGFGITFESSSTLMAQARLSVGFELFEHLGAFAGVSYDYFYSWSNSSPLPENMLNGKLSWGDKHNTHRIGFFAGIQF